MHIRRFVSFITLVALLGFTAAVSAQDELELPITATLTDDALTLSINHSDEWYAYSDGTTLTLADTERALDAIVTQSGEIEFKSLGIVLYAPGTAAALDLPADTTPEDALAVFLESIGLRSSSGTIYEGDPAISFGVRRVQDDGSVSFEPVIEGAAVDAFAFPRGDTVVFGLVYGTDDHFALTEAMWDTLTVTPADPSAEATPAVDGEMLTGEVEIPVTDEGAEFTFSVTLPDGWVGREEETDAMVSLASRDSVLNFTTVEEIPIERGDALLTVLLPPAVRAFESDPLAAPDTVLTEVGAYLGYEVYPALVEGFDVPVAQAYAINQDFSDVQIVVYTFGFPDGAVTVILYEINGSSNLYTGDVLRSIGYAAAE